MYLHLGGDVIVPKKEIVAICDIDNATWARDSRDFLSRAEKAGELINAAEDIPRSFVLRCRGRQRTVYLSQLSPAALTRRFEAKSDNL